MESQFNLPMLEEGTVKLLQITDTHLFATVDETLLGVNTYYSFHAVLDAVLQQSGDYDLVVATGDLAQDHSFKAYQLFVEGIGRLSAPCVWLPGNHDFQPAMVDVFTASGITPSKQVLIGQHWQLLLMDSQLMGVPHGELSDYQLEWLERCLSATQERYSLILLHHHPTPSGCTWLDQHSLRNAHMLGAVIERHSQVKGILCGHIHQEMDEIWRGVRLLATPSTCVQFKPHSTNFAIDAVSPGWRTLSLHPDGKIETQVYRLTGSDFHPDMESNGY